MAADAIFSKCDVKPGEILELAPTPILDRIKDRSPRALHCTSNLERYST